MKWSAIELEIVRRFYADSRTDDIATALRRTVGQVYQKAAALGLKKSEEYLFESDSGRIQRGRTNPQMVATQFKPGLTPWNKGVHYQAGGRSSETQFKPGSRPHTWVPVGSYRVNADGYLDRKVSDTGYPPRDWQGVHRLVWIAAHGEIPSSHVVAFKAGKRSALAAEITLDALELVSRAELARRNHPRKYGPEIAKAVQLRGAITRQINKRLKEGAQS